MSEQTKKIQKDYKIIYFSLPVLEYDAVSEIAQDERRSFASVIRQAVKEWLERRKS